MKGGILYHDDFLKHDTGDHVENAGRLKAIMKAFEGSNLKGKIEKLTPRSATDEELNYIHPKRYVESIEDQCQHGGGWLDGDTYASKDSARVARLAAGGAIVATEAVLRDGFDWVFGAVRPPGHHATPTRAMGFCIYNNAAIAARAAQKTMGIKRVLIFDWDVHHGNGTQDAFYEDNTVLYMSTHQSPLYPGSGRVRERGAGSGTGYTVNIPLPPGCGDKEYLYAVQEIFVPVAKKFDPELVIISAGFDGHREDPLASQNLSTEGFATIARLIQKITEETSAKGKMVTVLEGGYNKSRLAESVIAIFETWQNRPPLELPLIKDAPMGAKGTVDEIKKSFPEWFEK